MVRCILAVLIVSSAPRATSFTHDRPRTAPCREQLSLGTRSSPISPLLHPNAKSSIRLPSSPPSRLHLSIDDTWDEISSRIGTAGKTVEISGVIKTLSSSQLYETFSREWFTVLTSGLSDLAVVYSQLPIWAEVGLVFTPALSLGVAILYRLSFPTDGYRSAMEPYPRGSYDPVQARVFYSRHKLLALQRVLQMFRLSNRFIVSLLLDKYVFKAEERNRAKRADDLLVLITRLGPTAIKSKPRYRTGRSVHRISIDCF
jgi:hypothetical protein